MEQYGEIRIPEIEEQNNKDKKVVIAAIIGTIVVVILFAAVGIMRVRAYYSDERILYRSFMNLVKEVSERQKLWEDAGVTLSDGLGASKTEISLNLSGEDLPVTIGIDQSVLRDESAHQIQMETEFSVMNYRLLGCEIYGDDEKLVVSLPELFKQNLELSPENIDRQYNRSLLAEKFGSIEETGISIDLFQDRESNPISVEKLEELLEVEKPDEPIQINKVDDDDKQRGYSRYRIVIPKEWAALIESEIMKVMESDMAESGIVGIDIMSDIVLSIDIEKNRRITMILLEEPIQLSVEYDDYAGIIKYDGSISFLGEKRSIDDIDINMESEVLLSRLSGDGEDAFSWEDAYLGEIGMQMNLDANVSYNEKAARATYDIDSIEVSIDELGSVKLTGEIEVEPIKERILPPKGETIKIFKITEEEYEDLEGQLQENIFELIGY